LNDRPSVVPPQPPADTGGWHPTQAQYRPMGEPVPRSVNGFAIASMVLGIVSFFMPWLAMASIAAVAIGLTGRNQIRRFQGETGDGFAVAGITLGIVSFLYYLIMFRGLFLFWMPW
jgi:cobalamin synthase